MKSRLLIAGTLLTTVLAAPAAFAAQACDGASRKLMPDQRAAVAAVIARQLNVQSVTLLDSFGVDNWLGAYVSTTQSDEAFVFFAADPTTHSYSSVWSGAAKRDEGPALKAWALKENPGIPPALASCFAWFVTVGRQSSAALEAR